MRQMDADPQGEQVSSGRALYDRLGHYMTPHTELLPPADQQAANDVEDAQYHDSFATYELRVMDEPATLLLSEAHDDAGNTVGRTMRLYTVYKARSVIIQPVSECDVSITALAVDDVGNAFNVSEDDPEVGAVILAANTWLDAIQETNTTQ